MYVAGARLFRATQSREPCVLPRALSKDICVTGWSWSLQKLPWRTRNAVALTKSICLTTRKAVVLQKLFVI